MATRSYIDVNPGQTAHLRSTAATQTSNVITELPRGYAVDVLSSADPFKRVEVWDGMENIKGYVHRDCLSTGKIACSDDDLYIPRYSTTSWKRANHYNKKNTPVLKIQKDLISIGYTQVGKADGYYGANTETAVKAFQSANGLTSDGVFGKASKKKLWSLIDRKG